MPFSLAGAVAQLAKGQIGVEERNRARAKEDSLAARVAALDAMNEQNIQSQIADRQTDNQQKVSDRAAEAKRQQDALAQRQAVIKNRVAFLTAKGVDPAAAQAVAEDDGAFREHPLVKPPTVPAPHIQDVTWTTENAVIDGKPAVIKRSNTGLVQDLQGRDISGRSVTPYAAPNQAAGTPSESERRAGALYQIAENGLQNLESVIAKGKDVPGFWERQASKVGMGGGNFLSSSDLQLMDNAARQLASAYLYVVSGATARPDEVLETAQTYTPQPGDKPAVLEQKERARRVAIAAIRTAAGRSAPGLPTARVEAPVNPYKQKK